MKDRIRGWLLKIQTVTRTDMLYAARGGFWLTFTSAYGSLLSFLSVVFLANLVPKEAYGFYKYALSVAGVLSAFTLTGLGDALSRAVARGYAGSLRSAFRMGWRWSLPLMLAAVGMGGWYYLHGNATLGASMLCIALFQPLILSASTYGAFLNGKKDFRSVAVFGLWRGIVPLTLVAAAAFRPEPVTLLLAYFISNVAFALAAYALVLRRNADGETDPELAPLARHLSLVNVIGSIAASFDRVLIFQHLGAIPTAVYSFASALPDHLDTFGANLYTLALPKLATHSKEDAQRGLFRKIAIVIGLSVLLVTAYVLAAPFLFRILFPQYLDAVPYTMVLSLMVIATGASRLPMAFLTSQKAVRERYLIGVFGPGLRIVLMLALVVPFGIWGVVWARVLTKYLSFFFVYYLVKRL